ncbi:MAG: hypothetical protein QNI96_06295 [Woeseiaceae bacterium]|nr:hypothetical protein [Woeseiaceae bacterium]
MKVVRITAASAAMFMLIGSGPVIADGHGEYADEGIIPVEIFACNFRDGKGPDDLDAVNAKWNEWMDDNEATDYFAALMYPNFSTELNFDVAWIGGWEDGNAMGAGGDMWLNEGGEVGAEFNAVLKDCPAHVLFATMNMREPKDSDDDEDDNFVLAFSNCTMNEGKTFEDVQAAQEKWNAHADEYGFVGGSWVMWPIWGESADADYDFKYVSSAPNYTALGNNFQLMAAGHWRKNEEIWGGLMDCDSARIYSGASVREMPEDDG